MSGYGNNDRSTSDPFTAFWSEMMTRMSSAGMEKMAAESRDATMKAMRQAFFDAWQQHWEEFMKSEAFLEGMKRSMDGALTFKEQLNAFVSRSLQDTQIPTREDTDSILQVLRGFEERVLDQVEALNSRVAALEKKIDRAGASK